MKLAHYPFRLAVLALGWLVFLPGALAACSGYPPAPVTRTVTQAPLYIPPTRLIASPTVAALPLSTPLELRPSATPSCTDQLIFRDDLSIPDGSQFSPGEMLDKRWEVENSGTCNWDDRYSLRLIAGSDLGVQANQSLFPARSRTKALIRILFTAPEEPGPYRSAWQAYDPHGEPFGDQIFIDIVVADP
jgi:hypothetical protein